MEVAHRVAVSASIPGALVHIQGQSRESIWGIGGPLEARARVRLGPEAPAYYSISPRPRWSSVVEIRTQFLLPDFDGAPKYVGRVQRGVVQPAVYGAGELNLWHIQLAPGAGIVVGDREAHADLSLRASVQLWDRLFGDVEVLRRQALAVPKEPGRCQSAWMGAAGLRMQFGRGVFMSTRYVGGQGDCVPDHSFMLNLGLAFGEGFMRIPTPDEVGFIKTWHALLMGMIDPILDCQGIMRADDGAPMFRFGTIDAHDPRIVWRNSVSYRVGEHFWEKNGYLYRDTDLSNPVLDLHGESPLTIGERPWRQRLRRRPHFSRAHRPRWQFLHIRPAAEDSAIDPRANTGVLKSPRIRSQRGSVPPLSRRCRGGTAWTPRKRSQTTRPLHHLGKVAGRPPQPLSRRAQLRLPPKPRPPPAVAQNEPPPKAAPKAPQPTPRQKSPPPPALARAVAEPVAAAPAPVGEPASPPPEPEAPLCGPKCKLVAGVGVGLLTVGGGKVAAGVAIVGGGESLLIGIAGATGGAVAGKIAADGVADHVMPPSGPAEPARPVSPDKPASSGDNTASGEIADQPAPKPGTFSGDLTRLEKEAAVKDEGSKNGAQGELNAIERLLREGKNVEKLPDRGVLGQTEPDLRVDGKLREIKTRHEPLNDKWIKKEIHDSNK